ncbi:uncharacterized protein LOC144077527 [Stigmatopora argus]
MAHGDSARWTDPGFEPKSPTGEADALTTQPKIVAGVLEPIPADFERTAYDTPNRLPVKYPNHGPGSQTRTRTPDPRPCITRTRTTDPDPNHGPGPQTRTRTPDPRPCITRTRTTDPDPNHGPGPQTRTRTPDPRPRTHDHTRTRTTDPDPRPEPWTRTPDPNPGPATMYRWSRFGSSLRMKRRPDRSPSYWLD